MARIGEVPADPGRMFIATRTLSTQGFTPFEVSMLRLKDDINSLQKEVNNITKHLEKEQENDSE